MKLSKRLSSVVSNFNKATNNEFDHVIEDIVDEKVDGSSFSIIEYTGITDFIKGFISCLNYTGKMDDRNMEDIIEIIDGAKIDDEPGSELMDKLFDINCNKDNGDNDDDEDYDDDLEIDDHMNFCDEDEDDEETY